MADTAVTHGTPEHPMELPPGFIPFDACERDFTDPVTGRARRLRIVRVVAEDQNSLKYLIEDLGPPTGEDGVFIPCEGANEMRLVHELLDQAKRNREERRARRLLELPGKQALMRARFLSYAEQMILAKAGASVSGPYQSTERYGY